MRGQRILLPSVFGALLVSAALVRRAPSVQAGALRVHAVSGPVSYIEGEGGNVGVLAGESSLMLIDDKLARARTPLLEAVEGLDGGPVEFLLNTHWHGDHVGNNESFGESTILSHINVRRRLAGDPTIEGGKGADTPPIALPDVTFEDSVTLHFAGEEIELVHYGKGHTDGDSVVFFKNAEVVHMGDLYFSNRFPFIDLNSGGSVEGYAAAVGAVLARIEASGKDPKVIPGHGPLATPKELAEYHAMLEEAIARVKEVAAEGWTAEEMVEHQLLGDLAETWGDPSRFLRSLAQDLAP